MKIRKFGDIKQIHFVGIGGAGMSGIAEVLLTLGYQISGSDVQHSAVTDRLQRLGARFCLGHLADNIQEAQLVVVSSAIDQTNPEIVDAQSKRIPIIQRAEMLAELMRFHYGIAVAGTHGKTTTTSLISSVLAHAGLDPTYIIGGLLNSSGTHARLGSGDVLVAEADESDASFLHLTPMLSVITNIDADHMATYNNDIKRLHQTFLDFVQLLPFYGKAVICVDDIGVQEIVPDLNRPYVTYGFSDHADIRAKGFKQRGTKTSFIVVREGKPDTTFTLNMPGEHNVLNALAVIAVAQQLDIEDKVIDEAFQTFQGVGRRFEVHGDFPVRDGRAVLVDDYGHHPREIKMTIQAARSAWPNRRLVMVFQPHRYSRTQALFEDFTEVLSQVDRLVMLDIYAASEEPLPGADARSLCRNIRQRGFVDPLFIADKKQVMPILANILQADDVLLMQGAGDIGGITRQLVRSEIGVIEAEGV